MENRTALKLIKEFEVASNATNEIMESMEGFRDVLKNYYDTYRELKALRDEIHDKGVAEDVLGVTRDLTEMNLKIMDSIETVKDSLDQVYSKSNNSVDKISQLGTELNGMIDVFNRIEVAAIKIDEISDRLSKPIIDQLDARTVKLEEIFAKIEGSLNGFNNNLISRLNGFEEKLNKRNQQFEQHINNNGSMLNKITQSISNANEVFNTSNESLNEDILKIVKVNLQLKESIEALSGQNEDILKGFFLLMDKWAADSVHNIALKRKA